MVDEGVAGVEFIWPTLMYKPNNILKQKQLSNGPKLPRGWVLVIGRKLQKKKKVKALTEATTGTGISLIAHGMGERCGPGITSLRSWCSHSWCREPFSLKQALASTL